MASTPFTSRHRLGGFILPVLFVNDISQALSVKEQSLEILGIRLALMLACELWVSLGACR